MKQIPALVGWLLICLALAVYCYGIYYAIFIPDPVLDKNNVVIGYEIPEPLDTLVATIGAILLTNLGAVLGISVMNPTSALASTTLISKKSIDIPPPLTKREVIQLICVAVYIIILITCFIAWACTFKKDSQHSFIVPLVQQYGKTLIGVITAYVAFVLGVNSRN